MISRRTVTAIVVSFVLHLNFGAVFAAENNECERAFQKVSPKNAPNRAQAVDYLQSFYSKCSSDLVYLSRLSADYLSLKQYEDSERVIQHGLNIDPTRKELLLGLAELRLVQKNAAEASIIATKLMKFHPKFYGGYSMMQRSMMEKGRFAESIEFGQKALLYENFPVLWLNLAVAGYHSGQYELCINAAERAIKLDGLVVKRPWGINEAIYAFGELGKFNAARELARKRMNADPEWRRDRTFVNALKMLEDEQN